MFGVDWTDSQTLWLNLTNLTLGIVTLICIAAVAYGVAQELFARRRVRQSLDDEVRQLTAGISDPYTMQVPGLGLTMADGGEPIDPKKEKRPAKK
jgi:hypothetical protein